MNPEYIDVIKILKCFFDVETKHTIFVPFKTEWVFDPNIVINLALEIYTKMSLIWYIEICVWNDELKRKRPLNDAESRTFMLLFLILIFWRLSRIHIINFPSNKVSFLSIKFECGDLVIEFYEIELSSTNQSR